MGTETTLLPQLRWWQPIAVLLLLAATLGSGQRPCPRGCTCFGQTANCSMNQLTVPPLNYPPNIKIINIEGNRIRVLGSGSFTRTPNIEALHAAGNRIRRLNNDAFSRPFPNLVTLDLSRNRIRRITNNALRNMAALNTLDLSRNQIRSLRRIFHGTPNLYQVKLTRNLITRLGENDLAPLTTVHSVDLRSNRISNIHPRAFKALTRLRYLYLQNNPIGRMPVMDMGSQVLQMVDMSYDRLTAVPGPFPASTKEIRFNHNLIVQVNHTDFLSVQDLRMIMMNDNKLNFFADGALAHMTDLSEVWLRNNELVYIPRHLPDSVRSIYMNKNNIQEIESGLFTPNSQLALLDVQENSINRIEPNTFSGLQFLQSLNFQVNEIGVLETDTFVGLGSLSTLVLTLNPIVRIEDGAFRNLANLATLQLSYIDTEEVEIAYNFLPEMLRLQTLQLFGSPGLARSLMQRLGESHITPLSRLNSLDLSHCGLETLPPQIRQVFPNIRSLLLDDEPSLRCTHSMRWLKDWMAESGANVQFFSHPSYEPKCNTPFRLQGRPITSLLDSEWATDEEADNPTLPARGPGEGGMPNDQPQELRMRAPGRQRERGRGRGRGFMGTLVKVRGSESDQKEAKDADAAAQKAEEEVQPMSMVSAGNGMIRKKHEKGEKRSPGSKTAKPKRKGKEGKKGKNRRQGRKGKKGGRGKKRGRKDRKNRKDRERKRRRRVTINTSNARREAKAKGAQ